MKRIMNGNGHGEWSITSSDYYKAFERLAAIEDILGDDYDLERLAAILNQRMSMREDVAERWKLTSDIHIDRLRELAQADRDGRCVVHCNDCRWGQMDDIDVMHCHKHHIHTKPDDFCSYGERKEYANEHQNPHGH